MDLVFPPTWLFPAVSCTWPRCPLSPDSWFGKWFLYFTPTKIEASLKLFLKRANNVTWMYVECGPTLAWWELSGSATGRNLHSLSQFAGRPHYITRVHSVLSVETEINSAILLWHHYLLTLLFLPCSGCSQLRVILKPGSFKLPLIPALSRQSQVDLLWVPGHPGLQSKFQERHKATQRNPASKNQRERGRSYFLPPETLMTFVTTDGHGTCVCWVETRMLKSYRAQDSPIVEYCSVYNVSSTQAEGTVGQVWKRMQYISSHEAKPLKNRVGTMPLKMFCLKILI